MSDDTDDRITTAAACILIGGNDSPIHPVTLWRWAKQGRLKAYKPAAGVVRYSRRECLALRDMVAA